jgi:flavin reductase (DIM6/NTAB) family NADH-FMN oxidoreductase RutF
MSVSANELKKVMALVAATVTVVTAKSEGGPVGLTVSSFVSVSADPAIVLVCLEKGASSQQPMIEAEGFTVNVMPQGAEEEAMHFATRGVNRFEISNWREATASVAGPVLESALAHFECVTLERTAVGDHWVVYGEVLATEIGSENLLPLVWRGRGFVNLG